MLLNLIASLFIATSIGAVNNTAPILDKVETPTTETIKKPPIKKELEQLPFQVEIDFSNYTQHSYSGGTGYLDGEPDYPIDQHYTMGKSSQTQHSSAMLVKANQFCKSTTMVYDIQDPNARDLYYYQQQGRIDIPINISGQEQNITYASTQDKWINAYMLVMQITPYGALIDVGAETEISINLYMDYLNTTPYTTLYETYVSIEPNWVNYLDSQTWTNKDYIENTYVDINSGANGYNWTYHQQEIDGNSFYDENTITENIQIVTDKTNYVVMFLTTKSYAQNGDTNFDNMLWMQLDGTDWAKGNVIQYNGTMIPPIANYEYIDLPGLMFNILTMPFSFISTAFNITIFPGTPYQLNISALLLAIIGVLVFVFVIKKLTSLKG